MTLTEQVKWAVALTLSIDETPTYLRQTLKALDIEHKVEEKDGKKWSVFFRNENSTPDSPAFTHLEFEV
jgi:hypothetical protein